MVHSCVASPMQQLVPAHFTTLTEGESFASIDLQINFFRPVWNERLRAVAKPIHERKDGKSLRLRHNQDGWEVSRPSHEHDHEPSRRGRPREESIGKVLQAPIDN